MDDSVRLVLTTIGDLGAAEDLVRRLVAERHVVCGTILPGARSIYRWQGSVQEESEVVILLKTSAAKVEELLRRAEEVHPYDVPELLVLPVAEGNAAYVRWILTETGDS